jgi:hypothetical protein
MMIFFITLGIFLLVILAMAIGYIVQRKTIAGSCGGLGAVGIEKACDCEKPCEKRQAKMAAEELKNSIKVTNI